MGIRNSGDGSGRRLCILLSWTSLSKKTLDESCALFLVNLRARFKKHLTNLCHAATFRRSNSFESLLKI
jgi:hypothetical protein